MFGETLNRSLIVRIALAVLCGIAPSTRADESLKLFERHCYACHTGQDAAAGLKLDELIAQGDGQEGRWKKTWKIVRHGFMPPVDGELMSDEDRQAITRWMEDKRLGVDRTHPDPGRVTIRRLNRMEYEYTIADLFGVETFSDGQGAGTDGVTNETRLRDMLPPDDTAFGFDNIGDFQTLSPALFEKYLNLAEFVVQQVVSLDGPKPPAQKLVGTKTHFSEENKRVDHEVSFDVAEAGEYQTAFLFSVGSFASYRGAFDFIVEINGERLLKEGIEVGGNQQYRFSVEKKLAPGRHRLHFATEAVKPDSKGKFHRLELAPKITLTGPDDPGFAVYPETHRRIFFHGSASEDTTKRREYAEQILRRVADRAWRRPISQADLSELVDVAVASSSFEQGIAQGLTMILSAPHFLYRAELQPKPDDPKEVHPIDEFALASRLSSLLWLSIPDDELRGLAARGELRQNLPAQLRRMLSDHKSNRFFEDFAGQWLRTRNVLMTPVAAEHSSVNSLRASMKRETEMLFEYIAKNDRDLLELITADYTFLDKALADFYGLPFDGDEMRRVVVPPESSRGGILGQAVFLFSTSNPGRTSPVKRGLFVLENLLAIEPPPPPPSVPALDEVKPGEKVPKTVREQLAKHREDQSCAACHAHFDPIGLALENFDCLGRFRTDEAGEPIAPNETTTTGQTLTGIEDLKAVFATKKDRFYHCVTEKLLTYALGRGLEPDDGPSIEAIAEGVAHDGGKFSTLLREIVESPAFQMRRGDDGRLNIAPRVNVPKPPPPEDRDGKKFEKLIFPNGRIQKPKDKP